MEICKWQIKSFVYSERRMAWGYMHLSCHLVTCRSLIDWALWIIITYFISYFVSVSQKYYQYQFIYSGTYIMVLIEPLLADVELKLIGL